MVKTDSVFFSMSTFVALDIEACFVECVASIRLVVGSYFP
jgi:hypothetical protein